MFEIKSIRTFAMSAKNLDKSVEFYTKIVGGKVVKTVEPTEEQLKTGQVKEVDVRLGNFEEHMFDASKGPRAADPHHTLNIPWQDKDEALKMLQDAGAMVEKVRPHRGSDNYSINVFDPDSTVGNYHLPRRISGIGFEIRRISRKGAKAQSLVGAGLKPALSLCDFGRRIAFTPANSK